jgi:hypothetical protein
LTWAIAGPKEHVNPALLNAAGETEPRCNNLNGANIAPAIRHGVGNRIVNPSWVKSANTIDRFMVGSLGPLWSAVQVMVVLRGTIGRRLVQLLGGDFGRSSRDPFPNGPPRALQHNPASLNLRDEVSPRLDPGRPTQLGGQQHGATRIGFDPRGHGFPPPPRECLTKSTSNQDRTTLIRF